MKIEIEIKGRTPLLMCAFTDNMLSEKEDKNALPRERAEKLAYKDKKGNLFIPMECMLACIMEAGKWHKLGKNKVTTVKSSLIPAIISINEEKLDLGTKEFEVDTRRVVVPATGGAILRHRPRLDDWSTKFTVNLDTTDMGEKAFRAIVNDAGLKCGILAYRPTCKGWFGRFDVTGWKVLS